MARLSPSKLLLPPLPKFGQSIVRKLVEGQSSPLATTWSQYSAKHEQRDLKSLVTSKTEKADLRLIAIGEQHHQPSVLKMQLQVIDVFSQLYPRELVLVVEYFNLQQDRLLNDFLQGKIDLDQLNSVYTMSSGEGFDINHLAPLLVLAKERAIQIVGAFPPREWAREFLKDRGGVLEQLRNGNGYDRGEDVKALNWGHEAHFESLLSGEPPKEERLVMGSLRRGRRILPAQLLKDSVMAWRIDEQLRSGKRVIAIAGIGHLEYSFGVMERVREAKQQEALLILSKTKSESPLWIDNEYLQEDEDDDISKRPVADAIFLYDAVDAA